MKASTRILYFCIALLWMAGCGEPGAETGTPQSYSKDGLTFDHPGNWEVKEDAQEGVVRYAIVETPGDALLSIHLFPQEDALDLQSFAQALSQSAGEHLAVGTISSSNLGTVETEGEYESLTEQFTITLMGQDVPHTRFYRRRAIGDRVCFIMGQVSDEDRASVVDGFEQIFSSLKYAGK